MNGRRGNSVDSRRGMAVLMVILLLSITLGLSYAMVRFQNTAVQVELNMDRRESARHAAITGLTMAIKKMQTSAWGGVDSTLSGSLSAYEQFSVTYTTGDATLTSASPDWNEYPFRVTLDSTGTAADPSDSRRVSTHRIRAVVRLVPRKLGAPPADWTNICSHTLYQHSSAKLTVDPPFHIEGKVSCPTSVEPGAGLAWNNPTREKYVDDLNSIRWWRQIDARWFSGTVYLDYSYQQSWVDDVIWLGGASVVDRNSVVSTPSWLQQDRTTYQLYTGGKTYVAPQSPDILTQTTQGPDPLANPLGLLVRSGQIEVQDNVTVQGTLAALGSSGGALRLTGRNVNLKPVDLPALYGTTQAVQAPVIITESEMRVRPKAVANITGMLAAINGVNVEADAQADGTNLTITGTVLTRDFVIAPRTDWLHDQGWWDTQLNEFHDKGWLYWIWFFPDWLATRENLSYTPRVSVKTAVTPPTYHWLKASEAIYVAHDSDGGLRWEMIRWTDNP